MYYTSCKEVVLLGVKGIRIELSLHSHADVSVDELRKKFEDFPADDTLESVKSWLDNNDVRNNYVVADALLESVDWYALFFDTDITVEFEKASVVEDEAQQDDEG